MSRLIVRVRALLRFRQFQDPVWKNGECGTSEKLDASSFTNSPGENYLAWVSMMLRVSDFEICVCRCSLFFSSTEFPRLLKIELSVQLAKVGRYFAPENILESSSTLHFLLWTGVSPLARQWKRCTTRFPGFETSLSQKLKGKEEQDSEIFSEKLQVKHAFFSSFYWALQECTFEKCGLNGNFRSKASCQNLPDLVNKKNVKKTMLAKSGNRTCQNIRKSQGFLSVNLCQNWKGGN